MSTQLLGDYQIIKQIGQGSLGKVFLAEHKFTKQHHMLKVLPEELAFDREFIQRFEQEVQLLAALDHPHIVKIHNVSSFQNLYFFVSDSIVDKNGETTNLIQYLANAEKSLGEEEVYKILHQIATALDYAHSLKVGDRYAVHQGLKLNNILIGSGEVEPFVKLCDFGLTDIVGAGALLSRTYRVVAEALEIGEALQDTYPSHPIDSKKLSTLHLSFLQNHAFLAPEQRKREKDQPIDKKCDIYAFGVLAYYLLMEEFPEGYFPMPSEKEHLQMNWDLLLKDCLAQHPDKRTSSLQESLEAVCQSPPQPQPKVATPSSATVVRPVAGTFQAKPAPATPSLVGAVAAQKVNSVDPSPVLCSSTIQRPKVDPDPARALHVDSNVKPYQPAPKEEKSIEPILTEMVGIAGGCYVRGSNDGNRDEIPKHQVNIDNFAIDIHPVTNEQFVRFLEVMGGEKDHNHNDLIKPKESRIKRSVGKLSIESGYAKHPVVGVTWYGASAYAKWVGKRLPTEAEWEMVAKSGEENTTYTTGENIEKTEANFFSSDTTTVMSYAPNAYGVYDLAGNVYEWCYDWYGYNYYQTSVQEPDNPHGPLQGVYRVLRGGCWKSLKDDLRCSKRHRNNPGNANRTYGFRCAANAQ